MSSALPAGLQGLRTAGYSIMPESSTESPLLSFRPPSECATRRAAGVPFATEVAPEPSAPPVRFRPLQRLPARGSGTNKVTEPPKLDRPPPTGFLNLVASSSAPDLLALFHARSAPGVHPPELCSFRAAARRLRRRCPPVVGMIRRSARAAGGRRKRRNAAPNPPPSHVDEPSKRPSPSGLCSTRKSATSHRRFRPTRSAWLSWDSSPPGFSPSPDGRDLHRASPHEILRTGASVLAEASSGYCYPTRLAGLSRDCRPSWGSATS
jgi:hypothetical protein